MRRSGRRTRVPFNPFVALSDITISTLVVITSLLMLFSALVTTSALINRRKEQLLLEISRRQGQIVAQAAKEWPRNRAAWHARGFPFLYRFPDKDLFLPAPRQSELSPLGKEYFRTFGKLWGRALAGDQDRPNGALVEIQVQGHCSQETGKNRAWEVSTNRAREAAHVLRTIPGFPVHLLSVAGYGWNRRAFEPSREAARRGAKEKRAVADRIDIVLIFANDQNNFVAAWDGKELHGPLNDVSVPEIRPDAVGEEAQR